jgi:WD40 repeat protein
MTRLFILSLLLSVGLSGAAAAQTAVEWRVICKDARVQELARKSLSGLDLKLFEWELKFGCPRRELPTAPVHEAADPSRHASHTDWVYDARYSADGRTILSASKDGSVGVWDVATGKLVRRIALPQGPAPGVRSSISYLRAAAFVGDGTTIAAAKDGYPVLLFDLATGARTAEWPVTSDLHRPRLAATKSGLLLLGGNPDQALAVDIAARTVRHRLGGHKAEVAAVAVSDAADLVATAPESDDSTRGRPDTARPVYLWRLSTGEKLFELQPRSNSDPSALAFSRDGTQLAALLGGTVHVYSLKDRRATRSIVIHPFAGFDIAFTADGNGLITCQAHPMLWDLATGEILRHFGPFNDLCHSIDVSPDGRFVVSTSMASDLKIWEIATGAFHRRLGIDVKPPR